MNINRENDSGLAVRVSSGTGDSFGINRPLNLTTELGDTFKKFSIRQNGFQQSNILRNTPHGYYVRQELNYNVLWYSNNSVSGFSRT
jgi:hypothetical protein